MIKTLVFDREAVEFKRCDNPDEISKFCDVETNVVWVDVADPTSADFDELAQEFGFHRLSIEDCRQEHQRRRDLSSESFLKSCRLRRIFTTWFEQDTDGLVHPG